MTPPAPHDVQRSAADDVSCPGLVFGSRVEVGYGHLHRLDLLIFGRDGADFVAHLVAFHRHILALNAGRERKKRGEKNYCNATTDGKTKEMVLLSSQ